MSYFSPFFSLIVPVFNLEAFLTDCLTSILTQSYQNFEVIIVNDGSLDNSQKIIDDYCNNDKRFVSYQQENLGVSAARNLGLQHAKGEWIWFIDGDDYIHDKALDWIASISTDKKSLDCLTFKYHTTHQRYTPPLSELISPDIEVSEYNCRLDEEFQLALQDAPIGVWCLCFRRQFYRGLLFDESINQSEDTLFALNIMFKANKIVHASAKPYYYYQRPSSASKTIDLEHIRENLKFVDYVVKLSYREPRGASYLLTMLCRTYIPDTMRMIFIIKDLHQRREAFASVCSSIIKLGKDGLIPKEYSYMSTISKSKSYCHAYLRFHVFFLFCSYINRHPRILKIFRQIFLIES
jgi:glycosyltransferase involved in cell wall biosynthesis